MKLILLYAFLVIVSASLLMPFAHAAGGAGGSWDNDSGFGGNGGSMGGSGSGGSWEPEVCVYKPTVSNLSGQSFTSPAEAAAAVCSTRGGSPVWQDGSPPSSTKQSSTLNCSGGSRAGGSVFAQCSPNPDPEPPPCPAGTVRQGDQCVPELKCPAGYVKDGNKCIWQCPAGYKMLGGNCVKDDMPEDCDPAIQTCDENGEPVCDCCGALTQLVNMTNTQINNDNRIISLTENIVTTMNTTNNNINNVNTSINNVNSNINTVNNNLTTINESIENIITTIENNKPDFDTSGIEAKLQQLIDKNMTIDGADIEMDFTPLLAKLDELNASIKANKYDDTSLKAKIDELINKDLSEITDRQDEQTSLLEDIKRLLMPTNEAGDPDLNLPEVEQNAFDPWGAIKGFNISQNMINASGECPADKTFTVMGATFSIPMTPMCTYLSYLAPIFLAMAYFQGAMIILRSGD